MPHWMNLFNQVLYTSFMNLKFKHLLQSQYGYFLAPFNTILVYQTCSNPRNKRIENVEECENKMDEHVKAIEMGRQMNESSIVKNGCP